MIIIGRISSAVSLLLVSAAWMMTSAQSAPDTIKFSHKQHIADAGAECLDCHADVQQNTRDAIAKSVGEQTCGKCHEEAIQEKQCTLCHTNPQKARNTTIRLNIKNFSHADHLKRGSACAVCHKDVDKVTATTEKNLPDMDMCLTCHDDKKAPGDCRTCHDNLADLKPAGHKSPWFMNKEHGRDARFNRMDCAKCHQESSCDACHKGQLSTRIHDLNFSFTHGIEARRGDKDCTVCHETQRFCITCHEAIK